VKKTATKLNLATRDDIKRLEKRITALEKAKNKKAA